MPAKAAGWGYPKRGTGGHQPGFWPCQVKTFTVMKSISPHLCISLVLEVKNYMCACVHIIIQCLHVIWYKIVLMHLVLCRGLRWPKPEGRSSKQEGTCMEQVLPTNPPRQWAVLGVKPGHSPQEEAREGNSQRDKFPEPWALFSFQYNGLHPWKPAMGSQQHSWSSEA